MMQNESNPKALLTSAAFYGDARPGGYYYLRSKDLPGFSFLLAPEEAEDVEKLSEALKPALIAFLNCYNDYLAENNNKVIDPRISYADLRGSVKGKPMNLVAELCAS